MKERERGHHGPMTMSHSRERTTTRRPTAPQTVTCTGATIFLCGRLRRAEKIFSVNIRVGMLTHPKTNLLF